MNTYGVLALYFDLDTGQRQVEQLRSALVGLALLCAIAVVIWFAIKGSRKLEQGLPREAIPPIPPTIKDGPGHFKIVGVDRATKMDTTWYCDAQSAANAKAKADLEGIMVTEVVRERQACD